MRPGARVQAAIEVLADIDARKRPAAEALKDWGLAHRFAGSSDRAGIGNLVHDALRKRLSHAARMESEAPRAHLLATLADWDLSPDEIAALCDPALHGPEPLSEAERAALARPMPPGAPDWACADVPEWLWPRFERAFGADAVAEGQAFSARAPLDLRVNTLKAAREKALKALEGLGAGETPLAPLGLRVPAAQGWRRAPALETNPAFLRGWVEVQDEASQLAVALSGARPGMQVADVCAGAGGKTLALAAQMENAGQIYAHDIDRNRLAPIFDRLKRAGARNVQVRPAGATLEDLAGKLDLVLVDAPCTGSGVWRRRPDAKWRLRPNALAARRADQAQALDRAAPLVKPGGLLLYATCSVLPEENEDQALAFLARTPGFEPLAPDLMAGDALGPGPARRLMERARVRGPGLLLSPARTGCDGFFLAGLRRRGMIMV